MERYTARTFSDRRYESNLLNSYGHSVPLVAGELQSKGSRANAIVLETSFGDEEDIVRYDLRPAYDVEEIEKLERTFTFSRKGSGRLTVRDEVSFRSPQTFGTALVTMSDWRQHDHGHLLFSDGEDSLGIEVRVEGGAHQVSSETIQEETHADKQPVRIGINLKEPVDRAVIEVVVQP